MTVFENNSPIRQEAVIANRIVTIRDEQVILDVHLAELYDVETRVLKQAVRRNKVRFLSDFMFELTEDEIHTLVSQNVIPSKRNLGGAVPFAFTENGVAMLSSVLKSNKAIEVNIAIMRTFTLIRKMLLVSKDVIFEISEIKRVLTSQEDNIKLIFEYLHQMEEYRNQVSEQNERRRIGYRREDER